MNIMMYYIVYVFRGAGLSGKRGNLIASSIQYVLNVLFTGMIYCLSVSFFLANVPIVPAIIYIDKWGRRPMLLAGTAFMGFFLMLFGGLQGRFGHWGMDGTDRIWMIDDNKSATYGIIVCSYLFVCSFAITMGPVSWTYPAEIFPMKVRAKAVSLSTSANWLFNFALAWAVPPGLENIAYKTYFIFGVSDRFRAFPWTKRNKLLFQTFNFACFIHVLFMYPETKGRTLEEIEEVFGQGHMFSAWKIKSTVGLKTLEDVRRQAKKAELVDEKASDV